MKPRLAYNLDGGNFIINRPLFSEAIVAATLIEVGDLVRYQTDATAALSGVGLFDTATEVNFIGISMGKTTTDMTSGSAGDQIPVNMRCIIECDLASAAYNFGEGLGYSGTKNTLKGDVTTTARTQAWFYGNDSGTITRGLVLVDVPMLRNLFAASVAAS